MATVREVCARRVIDLVLMPQPVEFETAYRTGRSGSEDLDRAHSTRLLRDIAASPYLRWKRLFDTVAALLLMLWLMPLSVLLAVIVFKDVGWPLLFWQLRLGQGGRELQIYKFRTWRAPFDRRGNRIPEELRVSRVGSLLRRSRLDELPQLLNVLAGDMSLIGPRPLLAQDQPPNATVRLLVRPGITGWAQVNGGARLTPGEKEALDTWYIRNASFWLDLRIIGMTLLHLFRGERRGETALAQAQSRQQDRDEGAPAATRLRLAPKSRGRRRDDGGKAAAVNS
ncbi:MAG TPA: sugar transferase [Stellaceae bacterium]